MSLAYKYRKAQAIMNGLNTEELSALKVICEKIQQAEKQLKGEAKDAFTYCYTRCQGLCCRNIQPDAILTLHDFVYALTLDPSLKEGIVQCLKNESLYTSDCLFLADGEGPCLFSPYLMPETCVNSFCSDHPGVNREVRHVRSQFRQLARFIRWRAVKRFLKRLF